MKWVTDQIDWLQVLVGRPGVLTTILAVDVLAYFGGLLYWYGAFMTQPPKPIWTWPFIPDCPLFGLLGGLGLLMVTAHAFWSPQAQVQTQRYLLITGGMFVLLWLTTYLPNAPIAWPDQKAMLAICGWALVFTGAFFQQRPAWLLALFACGQIKYGIWTITAWLLFWRNTALAYGSPLFTPDSVFMTITHIGLLAQGLWLLTYFKPDWPAIAVSFAWFALSDFMDYGVGVYPPLPLRFIPLSIMQWSTILVTILLAGLLWWLGVQKEKRGELVSRPQPIHNNPATSQHATKVGLP
jgi:uncharacterized membrane protein YpjA